MIAHMLTVLAFNADKISFVQTMRLSRFLINSQGRFKQQIAILMENSIIPRVDKLYENQIYTVMLLLKENEIDRTVYFDLLATEFARKYRTSSTMRFDQRCTLFKQLLQGGADSDSLRETLLWCFHDSVEATFLLFKQDVFKIVNSKAKDKNVEY